MAAVTKDEREAFAERLRTALARCRKRITTPTELANAFNLRWTGESISVQAAQKWITGNGMPAPDKIEVLAKLTGTPLQWLRYGIPVQQSAGAEGGGKAAEARVTGYAEVDRSSVTAEELRLLVRLRGLAPARRELVKQLVMELALDSEMWVR